MRARVSQTTLNRLAKLDAPLRTERQRAAYVIALYGGTVSETERQQFTRAQRTILSWPRIPTMDEWETSAIVLQNKLVADSYEDREDRSKREPVVIGKDPAEVSDRYKPSAIMRVPR